MLYPQQNDVRNRLDLSGFWAFKLDPDEVGESQRWFDGLSDPRRVAVPGSWNEQFDDTYNYLGMAWYVHEFYVPSGWKDQRILVRVGSANYFARFWVNGVAVGEHEGGHLPFAFDITEHVTWGEANTIAIQVENELRPSRVPPGNMPAGLMALMRGYPATSFDFFPYAGIHRPVILYAVPPTHIDDVTVTTEIDDDRGLVHVRVSQQGVAREGEVLLRGGDGPVTAIPNMTKTQAIRQVEAFEKRKPGPRKCAAGAEFSVSRIATMGLGGQAVPVDSGRQAIAGNVARA